MTPLLTLLGLCLLVITPCYLIRCLISPWRECRHCHGSPRKRRNCWHCDATGKRPRLAWRVLGYVLRTRRDAR